MPKPEFDSLGMCRSCAAILLDQHRQLCQSSGKYGPSIQFASDLRYQQVTSTVFLSHCSILTNINQLDPYIYLAFYNCCYYYFKYLYILKGYSWSKNSCRSSLLVLFQISVGQKFCRLVCYFIYTSESVFVKVSSLLEGKLEKNKFQSLCYL